MVASGNGGRRRAGLVIAGAGALLVAAAAFAQDASPTAFPASDLDLTTVVQSLLGSVNPGVLFMLTAIATAVHRIAMWWGVRPAISNTLLIALPLLVGGLLGGLSALGKAQMTTGGWIESARLVQSVLEGSIVNGGMAFVLGGVASLGLQRLGIGTAPSGPGPTA